MGLEFFVQEEKGRSYTQGMAIVATVETEGTGIATVFLTDLGIALHEE